jgi:hypothetical protein
MLTLFSTPKPFCGHMDVIQRNALKSWKLLHSEVEVILFGDEDGAAEVCAEMGLRYEPEVLRSEFGTKRLDWIFGKAQEKARYETVCYVNCDIILTRDFTQALAKVQAWRKDFLMVGRRWDIDVMQPLDFTEQDWEEKISRLAEAEGFQRFYHNIDYFAFRRGLYREIPPLVIGRIYWDHWVVGKARRLGAAVVDVSELVCAVHQNHDYGYHPKGMEGVWHDQEAQRNRELMRKDTRPATIEDATFRLTLGGIRANRFFWLAPAKRLLREVKRRILGAARNWIWHPVLNATRPVRYAMGLKKDSVPTVMRNNKRRHWMDQ